MASIKNAGNTFYKGNEALKAKRKYKKALKYVNLLRESMGSTNEDEEDRIRAVEVPLCLNIAAASKYEEEERSRLRRLVLIFADLCVSSMVIC